MKALIVEGEPQPVKQYLRGGGRTRMKEGTTHVFMNRGSPTTPSSLLRLVGISCLCHAEKQTIS